MRFFLILGVFIACFSAQAMAEETLVKPGQTVLNISASERITAQQDLLLASLRYEIDGADSTALQAKINGVMTKAMAAAKKFPDVSVVTDNYYVYPYDANNYSSHDPEERLEESEHKKPITWKGSQGISLRSKNSEALLKLMNELQSMGLQTNSLSYTLSPEAFETLRDSLMESALKKLSEKAERASKALGKSHAELVEVNVDTGYPQPPMPMMMARAEMAKGAAADSAAPVASPGEAEITLTVSARAVLK